MAVCEEDITATGNHAAGQLYCTIDPVHVTGHSPGHATWFYSIFKKLLFLSYNQNQTI
jgi:hypothetical protein